TSRSASADRHLGTDSAGAEIFARSVAWWVVPMDRWHRPATGTPRTPPRPVTAPSRHRPGTLPAAPPSALLLGVDAAVDVGEPPSAAAPFQGDDLGGDGHGRLLRGAGAEIETDRRGQSFQFGLAEPGLTQAGQPVVMRA